jgi:hypothetical protein
VPSGRIYWGVIYLAERIIRWWYFTCIKPQNIICDGILHVNMFHYFKMPYFTCTFFTKFTYNEYIGPYFLSHVVLRFSPVISPSEGPKALKMIFSRSRTMEVGPWTHTIEKGPLPWSDFMVHSINWPSQSYINKFDNTSESLSQQCKTLDMSNLIIQVHHNCLCRWFTT